MDGTKINREILKVQYGVEDRRSVSQNDWDIVDYADNEEAAKKLAEQWKIDCKNKAYVAVKIIKKKFTILDTDIEVLE